MHANDNHVPVVHAQGLGSLCKQLNRLCGLVLQRRLRHLIFDLQAFDDVV